MTAALVTGGGAALAGLPKFAQELMPDMAAQASTDANARDRTALTMPEGFSVSRYAPQVLYPVAAKPAPDWMASARETKPPAHPTGPVIAICIDDLGADLADTHRALDLPSAVTMSFLPYAEETPRLAQRAAEQGHLVLAHVPMQAIGNRDPGPMALKPGMSAEEITSRLDWNLARVPGAVGVNNHEGSRFTADETGLVPVMARLWERDLFFFDSRTGARSKGESVAREMGVMTAGRDIFLDDVPGEDEVTRQLQALVRQAKRHGVAIAIGHPRDATLKVLKEWLAQDHGVTLVPLDQAMRLKASRPVAVAAR
ncbi:MAG TPA: divergent polysaccharide deacetylase family protein [Rhizomicrobium sp.]|nr:divergent polysaccharide deacetylase family protein [Rhizomicrobium sp.]